MGLKCLKEGNVTKEEFIKTKTKELEKIKLEELKAFNVKLKKLTKEQKEEIQLAIKTAWNRYNRGINQIQCPKCKQISEMKHAVRVSWCACGYRETKQIRP
jgi:hypothetical protein